MWRSRFTSRFVLVSLALLITLGAAAVGGAIARSTHRQGATRRHRSALSLHRVRAANGRTRSRVIVLLRNQHSNLPPTRGLMQARTAAVRSSQAPLESSVRTSSGTVSHSYRTVDAFAAAVSQSERSRLAADPAVAEILRDHVNVLNESFGENPIPDTDQDAIQQFNDLATASGVTVTVASGDSGTTNTIGSPADDPDVLDVGASTQFQGLAQTGRGGYPLSSGGWASDNIAEFSSGGFTDDGRTLDLVAPGNESYEACTASDTYGDCTNFAGNASNLTSFGGTSESAPLTAGVAALVIQAYRQTHGGASPSPTLIKQIILGSARDLQIPSYEQGAGELNALDAVKAAESVDQGTATGSGHLTSPSQLDLAVRAGATASVDVRITNSGSSAQTYSASLRTLTTQLTDQKADVTLDPSTDPQFVSHLGVPQAYAEVHFTVPAGADRIDASLAHPGPDSTVNMTLLDPTGRFTAFTYHPADDFADFSHIDVRQPPAGTWTAVFSTPADGTGFTGAVHYDISTSRFGSVGTVSPSTVALAPGASASVHVSVPTPLPGDYSRDLQISGGGQTSVVPVVLRSLVPLSGGQGRFSGAITGGNGDFTVGRQDTFAFDVHRGAPMIRVDFSLPTDPNTEVDGYLVAPDGQTLARGVALSAGAETTQLVTRNPEPGRWTLVLGTPNPVGGTTTSGPFTGTISLGGVPIGSTGVPHRRGASIPEGGSATATVAVSNPGTAPLSVFVDPRSDQWRFYALTAINPPTVSLPLGTTPVPTWAVPTETNLLLAAAQAGAPITFEWGYGSFNEGDPDLESSSGTTAAGSLAARQVSPGEWFMAPALIGPFDSPKASTATTGMAARTRAFDATVSSSTGDPQLADVDVDAPAATPVTVAPGATVRIPVTFSPTGRRGTVVSGELFVDDNQPGSKSANELGAIPYSYRVRRAPRHGRHRQRPPHPRH